MHLLLALVIIAYFYSKPKSKGSCYRNVEIFRPDYQNWQQNLQIMGTMSLNYFSTDGTLRQSKEILAIDKRIINSASLEKPGALRDWKPTYIRITNPCQSKHFSCYAMFVFCKRAVEHERTEANSDSTFVCFPFIQNQSRIFKILP